MLPELSHVKLTLERTWQFQIEMREQLRTARTATLQRKGLSDITNSPIPLKILNEDSNLCEHITRDSVEQLIKEKMELLKLIEERNKIIELSEGELQRLRICYQKTQLQNRILAQTNSQMLAELNLGKDKLKALNHELACKNALLKAKNLELQKEVNHEAVSKGNDDRRRTICGNTKQQRSQSLGVSDINKQDDSADEKIKNKRQCVRRQSARFISQERESADDLFEIEEVKIQLQQNLENLKWGSGSTTPDVSNNEDTAKNRSSTSASRVSIGRPLRRATEKVQSYKEPSLNIKMRRES